MPEHVIQLHPSRHNNNVLRCPYNLPLRAQALYAEFNDVPIFEKDLRIHAKADPRWRARGYHVTGHEPHESCDVGDENSDIEDHGPSRARLHPAAVDIEPH